LSPNKQVDPPSGEDYQPPPIIKLRSKESDEVMDENGELQTRFYQLPLGNTSDLIGRTFLTVNKTMGRSTGRELLQQLKITMQTLKRT
jgi:hypothetical protein